MGSLIVLQDEIILGINRDIIFINLSESRIIQRITLPVSLIETAKDVKKQPPVEEIKLEQIAISPSGKYFAVSTSGQKLLFLYEISYTDKKNVNLIAHTSLPRVSSALAFTNDSKWLAVTDKTGDCQLFDCNTVKLYDKWIMGHLSIVLDILFSPDDKYVVTCDRDEKIRVSNFPESHNIECYCLGHLEYVSSIKLLPINPSKYLLSLSGDKTIKVWKYKEGVELHQIDIPAPGIKFSIQQVNETTCHIAVLVFQPDKSIFIYELSFVEDSSFKTRLISEHSFPQAIISNLQFNKEKLYLTLISDGKISIESLRHVDGKYETGEEKDLMIIIDETLKNENISELGDISGLFKKKFDNVSEYLEKKRRRIEEKYSNS